MPYRSKKRYKRKGRRRRRRDGYNQVVNYRNPFPQSMLTKHRYCQAISLNPGVATIASYQFRANDMFDPDFTSTGTQPLGFDEYSNLYDHFTVLGSKITVIGATTGTAPVVFGITVDCDGVITSTNFDAIQEQPNTRWATHVVGSPAKTISNNLSVKRYFNRKSVKDCSEFRGTSSTSPTELAFYHVWAKGLSASADPSAIDLNITIEFIALWSEPKELVKS